MTSGGPRITSDNLVLCLDAHDAKSYAGEPTTNRMTIYDGNLPNAWGTTTYSSYTAVNMRTPVGRKAHKLTLDKDGSNGYYGSPNPCRLTSSPSWSNNGLDHYYSMWITTDNWSKLDSSTYKYVTGSNGWPGFSATSRRARVGGREWRLYKGFISDAGNNGSGSEYFTFFKNGTYTEDMVFYIAGTMVHQNGNYATPVGSGTRSTTDAWKDRSGNGNHVDFASNQRTGVDHHRNGEVILPVSNAYIDFDGTDDLLNADYPIRSYEHTFSIWMSIDDVDSGTAGGVFCWGGTSTYGRLLYSNDKKLRVSLYASPDQSGWIYSSYSSVMSISDDTFFNLTVVSTSGKQWIVYCNGEQVLDTGTWRRTYISSGNTKIGLRDHVQSSDTGRARKYSSIRIHQEAQTSKQVKANFNAHRGRYGV